MQRRTRCSAKSTPSSPRSSRGLRNWRRGLEDTRYLVVRRSRRSAAAQAHPHISDSNPGRLADGLMELLESDRARVAGVLGDEAVSVITMARYLIEHAARRLTRGGTDEASEALQNASTRLRDATCQLLVLCSELHPKALDDLGLLPALSSYFRDFSQENQAIFVSRRITVSESDVPSGLKLAIFGERRRLAADECGHSVD